MNNNIIQTYYEYLTYQGKTLDDGISEMNAALGREIDKNYFYHMKSASKPVSKDLHRYLVDQCYEFMAKQAGYRDIEKFERAMNGLMVPRREK